MSFRDYSNDPAANTTIGETIYIGPDMARNDVRPALQQLAADGKEVFDVLLDQGDPVPSGLARAASRTALAAITGQSADMARLLVESGRQGLFVFDSSDLSAKVSADTAQGIYVAPAAATSGASGAWVRQFSGAWDARWFGVLFDDEGGAGTDNTSAINAMLALAGTLGTSKPRAGVTTERPSVTIIFPGYLYCASAINLTTQVHLKGFSGGQAGGAYTRWRVPSGTAGLIVNGFGTYGYSAAYDATKLTSAQGSIIEGIRFLGGTEGVTGGGASYDATAQADGLLMRARAVVKDCRFESFKRNGIAIYAGTDANPIYGNANNWVVTNCTVTSNGMHGLHVNGTDANAGYCIGGDFSSNRRWGILEESFLGNQYISVHTSGNGVGNGTTDVDSVVAYPAAGQRYAVAYGQEASASTTTPGTDITKWIPISGATGGRTWTSGITVRSGGPIALQSASQELFGYNEGGQGPQQCASPSMTIGGLKGASNSDFAGTGIRIRGNLGNVVFSGGLDTTGLSTISGTAGGLSFNGRTTGSAYQIYNDNSILRFWQGGDKAWIDSNGAVNATGGLVTSGGRVGYDTGAGGTSTQITSKSTAAPALNKSCGEVTMNNASLAAATIVSFTMSNSVSAATDTVIVNHVSGGTLGAYTVNAVAGSGTMTFYVRNNTAGALAEALVLRFAIIKAVTT